MISSPARVSHRRRRGRTDDKSRRSAKKNATRLDQKTFHLAVPRTISRRMRDDAADWPTIVIDKVERVAFREPFLIERAPEAARPARVRPRDHDGASSGTLLASRTPRRCRSSGAQRAAGAPSRSLAVSRPRECSLTCPLRLSRAGAHAVHQGCRRLRQGGHRREGGRPRPHRPPHRAVHRLGGCVPGADRGDRLSQTPRGNPETLRTRSRARRAKCQKEALLFRATRIRTHPTSRRPAHLSASTLTKNLPLFISMKRPPS